MIEVTKRQEELQLLAVRLGTAISRFEMDHDVAFAWEYEDRKASFAVGPNALAGFPFATGRAEHLNRFEALVLAAEAAADASEARAKEQAA